MVRHEYFLNSTGILSNFINHNVEVYAEPQRIGVPKGDNIGFSRAKYAATYYLLCNFSLKEISDRLRVSYSVLTNWKTETAFKNQLNRNVQNFKSILLLNIRESISDINSNIQYKGNAEAAVTTYMDKYFDDIDIYREDIILNLRVRSPNHLRDVLDRNNVFIFEFNFSLIEELILRSGINNKTKNNLIVELKRNYTKAVLSDLINKMESKGSKLSVLQRAAKKRKEADNSRQFMVEALKFLITIT